MRSFTFAVWLVACLATSAATAQPAPREVNVTSESERGWVPSVELEQAARDAATRYFAAHDTGQAREAYAMLDPINAASTPFDDYAARLRDFVDAAGRPQDRRVIKLTWTKDPASAPAKGVYVAIDFASRFEKAQRHCGYVMLRQAAPGEPFRVMRDQSAYMTDAAAASLKATKGSEAVDGLWAELSRTCPNYAEAARAGQTPLPEAAGNTIGYRDVATALAALRAKPGVRFSNERGWTIAEEAATATLWSFAPKGHPAYPSAIRRQLVKKGAGLELEMTAHCQSTKEACDALVREFEQLNEAMTRSLQGRR